MSPTVAERLQKLEGPVEKSPEARQIEKEVGFSYRNVLGELMHAHVVARLDIGFAVCLLARFSGHPHREHNITTPSKECVCIFANTRIGELCVIDHPH